MIKLRKDQAEGDGSMPRLTMPVGKSDFAKVRTAGDYYIDKTDLIRQIASSGAEVTLFTRPRRFGKSLNMSMLQHFFDIREQSGSLFEGLRIADNKELCENWMNKYPTILVSFKTVEATNFNDAVAQLKIVLADLFRNYVYLLDNEKVDEDDANKFKRIKSEMPQTSDMMDSLSLLSRLLYTNYNRPVVLLIDEYDVPLAKADTFHYYESMINIMRSIYNKALKDNPYIKIAVLTGCLRIAEESIFTGLNNLAIKSIVDTDYDECFGFTRDEMNKLLTDTGLTPKQPVFKEWYDGYVFGNKEVYCPWDVLNYVDALQKNPNQPPMNYWANTSGNDVIKRFLESDFDVTDDFETLLGGGVVSKKINPNITYADLVENETNLWSVLYMTGYLTIVPGTLPKMTSNDPDEVKGMFEYDFKLRLPNKEIRMLFENTVAVWFKNKLLGEDRTELFNAIWGGDDNTITDELCAFLGDSISFYDYHELFYHAFLTGLLSGVKGVTVVSNREAGTGRADLILQYPRKGLVAIFEFKCADSEEEMNDKCDEALEQIEKREYSFPFRRKTVYKYGVAFFQKQCLVKKA